MVLLAFATLFLLAGCGPGGDTGGGSGGGQAEGGPGASKERSENPGGEPAELGTPALGSADAPVVLTEYSDYQ